MMHDVIVVGGGPSGLHVAEKLAAFGLDVLLLEKKSSVGEHIVCTGIVSQEAFSELALSKASVIKNIQKIRWISPFGSTVEYEHPTVFAHIVDRKKFDQDLSQRALSNGVQLELNHEVVDVSIGTNKVVVITKRYERDVEHYNSQVVIIATGVNYYLNKKLDLGYPKRYLNGVQAEISLENVDYTQVFLGRNYAQGAFAWLVPIGGDIVRIGLMTESDPQGSFTRLIERVAKGKMPEFERKVVQHKKIAQGLLTKTYGQRVLALGEAAAQIKTTTGGGIYFGLLCSEIASRFLKRAFQERDFSAKNFADYEREWKKLIQKEILFGYYARRFFSKFNDKQLEKLFKKAQTDGVIPLIREKGSFDWHSELILLLMKRIPFWEILKSRIIN
jgi:geranylgeranyl reductase family protein